MNRGLSIACSRGFKPDVYYSFGAMSCQTCESTHIEQLGLVQALFHERWCPRANANEGRPVHPTRRIMTETVNADGTKSWRYESVPCNGAIRYDHGDKKYWCQRCNDRSTILKNLIVEG